MSNDDDPVVRSMMADLRRSYGHIESEDDVIAPQLAAHAVRTSIAAIRDDGYAEQCFQLARELALVTAPNQVQWLNEILSWCNEGKDALALGRRYLGEEK